MENLLYIIAFILLLIWAIGFFGFRSTWGHGVLIHYLVLIAAIAIMARLYRTKSL